VRISALEEYGLRCLLALAKEGMDSQLSINDIAEREALSVPYASKLLSLLRKARLVSSVRGRKGGFCIARPADQITLYEVITALGGPLIDPDHCTRFSGQLDVCVHSEGCTVHHVLGSLAGYIESYLRNTTLRDVLEGLTHGLPMPSPQELNASLNESVSQSNNTENDVSKHTLVEEER
jgi:Rrf2 family protein